MSQNLPDIPDDDRDFTPELARKIIALYQEALGRAYAEQTPIPLASGDSDSGSRDPWHCILDDPRLDRVRSKLSIHEMRLIINHVRADNAEQDAAMVDEVLQARAENERLRAMLSKMDHIVCCRLICDTATPGQRHALLDDLIVAIRGIRTS